MNPTSGSGAELFGGLLWKVEEEEEALGRWSGLDMTLAVSAVLISREELIVRPKGGPEVELSLEHGHQGQGAAGLKATNGNSRHR